MTNKQEQEKTTEVKQNFLSSAISDITSYIQLADTKVSIIMAAVVAILVGILTCYAPIGGLISNIKPCTWLGVLFIVFTMVGMVSIVACFLFGILTIRGHSCIINYKSKWFLSKTTKEYSFDEFSKDVQKMRTMKWTLRSFSALMISIGTLALLFLINSI